jgi:hypothetical protein
MEGPVGISVSGVPVVDLANLRDVNDVDLGALYRHAKGLVEAIEKLRRRKLPRVQT